MSSLEEAQMSRLRRVTTIACAAVMYAGVMSAGTMATAFAAQPQHRSAQQVQAQVDGRTYVLLGPSVFGVTVQQDPLEYHAIKLADGTVRGIWRYDYWEAGQETTFSGPVTCLSVSGNRAWIGGPITHSSDPTQIGMGAW